MFMTLLLLVLALSGGLFMGTLLYSCAQTATEENLSRFQALIDKNSS